MSQEAHQLAPTTSPDTTGLEDFFSSGDKPGHEVLTLEEAAKRLNLSERTIQRRLKEGKIRGHKVSGPRGPEWRVEVSSTVDGTTTTVEATEDTTTSTVDTTSWRSVSSEDMTPDSRAMSSSAIDQVVAFYKEQLDVVQDKLESATYRNGFLEAQLSGAKSQIILLPDLEAKAKKATELEIQLAELEVKAKKAAEVELQLQQKAEEAKALADQVARLQSELVGLKRGWFQKFGSWFMGKGG